MSKPIIVDGYCRVSTDPQESNYSLDEQESCIRDYCQHHGLAVGIIHRETASGYYYRERDKLSFMRDRYREGKIQGVVVAVLDRLSRQQTHIAVLMDEMEHYGVRLHGVKEPIATDPLGKFVIAALALVAEMEREKIIDRTMTGRINAVKAGDMKSVSGPKVRYGWQWADETRTSIALNDAEAEIVREMAVQYAAGIGSVRIAQGLNERGLLGPSGGPWTDNAIMRILNDKRITGTGAQAFRHKAKQYKTHYDTLDLPDGTYPPIISMELFEKIDRRMEINKAQASRSSKQPEEFLLRAGYVRCSMCGWSMGARTDVRYSKYIYRCRAHGSIVSKPLDADIWGKVEQLAEHVALIEQAIQLASNDTKLQRDLSALDNSIDVWQKTADNYLEDLQDSSLRDKSRAAIRKQMNDAHSMVEKLESDRAQLAAGLLDHEREQAVYAEILEWCREVKEARGELSYQRKRDFIELLGLEVTIYYEKEKGNQGRPYYDMHVRLPALQELLATPDTNSKLVTPTSL